MNKTSMYCRYGAAILTLFSSAVWAAEGNAVAQLEPLDSIGQSPEGLPPMQINAVRDLVSEPDDFQWGLDRIDQRAPELNQKYSYNFTGKGVHVYVLSTGILTSHKEFSNWANGKRRIGNGVNFVEDKGNPFKDCHRQGTHVAGIVGGQTVGVAEEVILHPVRVDDCFGFADVSAMEEGLKWVAKEVAAKQWPAVVTISNTLGGTSWPIRKAIKNLIALGVPVVVAAGDNWTDECVLSPGDEATAITVGATEVGDYRAAFSNYGKCVDIFAPGMGIGSAWAESPERDPIFWGKKLSYETGTAQAAAFVTGVVALYLEEDPTLLSDRATTVKKLTERLECRSIKNQIKNIEKGELNRLVYSKKGNNKACQPDGIS